MWVWGRGTRSCNGGVGLPHPRSSPSFTPRGRGRTPTGRFPWEAGGGRRGLVPTPSLTLGREVGERGRRGAPNNKELSGERQPLPREPGVAAAGPAGTRLRGGSQRQCRRLGRCDSDPRVPRDPPTHRHTRGDAHTQQLGREEKTRAAGPSRENLAPHRHPARTPPPRHAPGKPQGRPDTRPDRGGADSPRAQTWPATRTATAAPARPAARSHPHRTPTQTHKSHAQTNTHPDSRARPLTLGATRHPGPGVRARV